MIEPMMVGEWRSFVNSDEGKLKDLLIIAMAQGATEIEALDSAEGCLFNSFGYQVYCREVQC